MNRNPETKQIEAYQWQKHDRQLGKVIGTRYPVDVEDALLALPQAERQALIREAVENALKGRGAL